MKQPRIYVYGAAAALLVSVAGLYFYIQLQQEPAIQASMVSEVFGSHQPRVLREDPPDVSASFDQKADWIRPSESEEAWQKIAWHDSLLQARQIAERTGRLLLIWGSNQPLGRC